MFMMSSLA
uniref:Uncharacterized protein n=1 Tax=Anguilla anguilla TaxID=7936 RepID=A0A0E9VLE8_ANGAN